MRSTQHLCCINGGVTDPFESFNRHTSSSPGLATLNLQPEVVKTVNNEHLRQYLLPIRIIVNATHLVLSMLTALVMATILHSKTEINSCHVRRTSKDFTMGPMQETLHKSEKSKFNFFLRP